MKLNHKAGSGIALALLSLGVANEAAHAAPLGRVARELQALDHEAQFNLRVLPGLTLPFLPVAGFAAIGQVGNIAVAGSAATSLPWSWIILACMRFKRSLRPKRTSIS